MKTDKSPEAQKVLKWHGNEEQSNISVFHMLQSGGVQAICYLKTKVIMKFILRPQHSYLDFTILVSTLLDWTVIND